MFDVRFRGTITLLLYRYLAVDRKFWFTKKTLLIVFAIDCVFFTEKETSVEVNGPVGVHSNTGVVRVHGNTGVADIESGAAMCSKSLLKSENNITAANEKPAPEGVSNDAKKSGAPSATPGGAESAKPADVNDIIMFSKVNPFSCIWKMYTENPDLVALFKINNNLRSVVLDNVPDCFTVSFVYLHVYHI